MASFANRKISKKEEILYESRGNYREGNFNPLGWIGGRWYLYHDKLVFISGSNNISTCENSISLDNLASIEVKYSDFISSKIVLILNDGTFVELHVPRRRVWIEKLILELKKIYSKKNKDWEIDKILNAKNIEAPKGSLIKVIYIISFFFMISSITAYMCFLIAGVGG